MKLIRRFIAILKKEFIQILKNPKTRITVLVPPIIQLFVLGYAATMDLKDVKLGILDHARTAESRAFTAKFSYNGVFIMQPPLLSEKAMQEAIAERKIKVAIVIPENFSRELAANRSPQVQVIADGRNSSSAGIAIGYVNQVVELYNQSIRRSSSQGAEVITRGWFNPNFNVRWFMLPAILALISLIILSLLVAMSFAKERDAGTIDQLLLTPYTPVELLLAKGLASVFVGLLQVFFCLLIIFYWFKLPYHSNYFLLFVLLTSFITSSVGIGLAVSVYCSNLQQALIGILATVVSCALLSGMVTPISSMPPIMQDIMIFNPVRWAIEALHRLFLEGADFIDIAPAFGMMTTIGLLSFSFACYSLIKQRS